MNTCVYGGTFDPPTMGHYHIIEKASKMFDCVHVVLAENPKKKSLAMFSQDERLLMLNDMVKLIDPTGEKVKVAVLADFSYLASYAKQIKAQFLIRGIRDQLDFGYEQNIYRTNRRIQNNVETIYLMPDDAYSLVSSSWIKGLIGQNGWVNVIKDSVTPFVLNELAKRFVKGKLADLLHSTPFQHYIYTSKEETIWDTMLEAYGKNDYHGFYHLIELIEAMNEYGSSDQLMLYAVLMHDINKSEAVSSNIARRFIRMTSQNLAGEDYRDKIDRLIMATMHKTCEYKQEDEKFVASIDLLVLARNQDEYSKYVKEVFEEYLKASGKTKLEFVPMWIKGRSEFLRKMLDRDVIYSCEEIRNRKNDQMASNETMARFNMTRELGILEKGTI